MDELKRSSFLVMKPERLSQAALASDNYDEEDAYEMEELAAQFLSRTGVWRSYFGGGAESSSQSPPNSDLAMQRFLQSLATPLASASLDTTWPPSTSAFAIVCVFTEDASGAAYPLRVAHERGMAYASVDSIIDECVQLSLDAPKQADAAASQSEREVRHVRERRLVS